MSEIEKDPSRDKALHIDLSPDARAGLEHACEMYLRSSTRAEKIGSRMGSMDEDFLNEIDATRKVYLNLLQKDLNPVDKVMFGLSDILTEGELEEVRDDNTMGATGPDIQATAKYLLQKKKNTG